jgi:hypothetical protein
VPSIFGCRERAGRTTEWCWNGCCQNEEVTDIELDPTQRVAFFRDVLSPLVRGIPFGVWFIRTFGQVDLDDSVEAAAGRWVFELHPQRL